MKNSILKVFLLLVAALGATIVSAQSKKAWKDSISQKNAKIIELESQIQVVEGEKADLQSQLDQCQANTAEFETTQENLDNATREIARLTAQVKKAEEALSKGKDKNGQTVKKEGEKPKKDKPAKDQKPPIKITPAKKDSVSSKPGKHSPVIPTKPTMGAEADKNLADIWKKLHAHDSAIKNTATNTPSTDEMNKALKNAQEEAAKTAMYHDSLRAQEIDEKISNATGSGTATLALWISISCIVLGTIAHALNRRRISKAQEETRSMFSEIKAAINKMKKDA